MMIQTTDLTKGVTTPIRGAEVEEDIGSREPTASQGTFGRLTLFRRKLWMDRVNTVHGIHTRQGFLGNVANQGGLKEVLG